MISGNINVNIIKLSETSRRMLELREAVLAQWEQNVRAAFIEARDLKTPVFMNTIPSFYDSIVEAVTPDYSKSIAVEGTSLAYAHGSERARLTNYDPEILILEYQILRSSIIHVLDENKVRLNKNELLVINSSIDEATREAVVAFSAVVGALREQFIAALAHDMRTPLSNASMCAELITLTNDPNRTKELGLKIVKNIDQVEKMVQGLLDTMAFKHGQQLRLEFSNFDLLEIVTETCQSSRRIDGPEYEIIGEPLYGWWGEDAMRPILSNLIDNAMKYGDPNMPVSVKLEKNHENLVLSVHNGGLPILTEEQGAVFQVFRRSKNENAKLKQGWASVFPMCVQRWRAMAAPLLSTAR